MTEPLQIDGSTGEGGGQMVRSSLALSMLTGRAVSIDNIRAGRKQPGLKQQHLTAVQAAARVCNACLSTVKIGSRALTFEPQAVQPGEYHFNIGSAGSTTLVLQTILPPLLTASGPSRIVVEGGTHNQWAPPFDFLQQAYLPLINRMGPQVTATLVRHGFYPAGGGQIIVDIEPVPALRGLHLQQRGQVHDQRIEVLYSNLHGSIARREAETLVRSLDWKSSTAHIREIKGFGPGNVVFARLEAEHVTEVFTACGRLGVKAEHVAKEVATQVQEYLATDVPVGPHLADQLLLPLGISAWQRTAADHQAGSTFRTMPLTLHSTTHIEILRRFLGIEITVQEESATACLVRLCPAA